MCLIGFIKMGQGAWIDVLTSCFITMQMGVRGRSAYLFIPYTNV